MNAFAYERAGGADEALQAAAAASHAREGGGGGAKFLGGGTNLVDLMKYDVEHPSVLVDVNHAGMDSITTTADGGLRIGASVKNSALANDPRVVRDYPLLSQALLSGASPQLRNMATTGGNLLQRTRCYYFMDTAFPACNKRVPGSGCAAIAGFNRIHAVLGQTDEGSRSAHTCIATNPSDMNVAMAALGATVEVVGPGRGGAGREGAGREGAAGAGMAKRSIPFSEFHRLPGTEPSLDTTLRRDELIVAVTLPAPKFAAHSWYLKARDRQSYAFALVSVAAGLEMNGGVVKSAGLALGGVAHKPWRSAAAEAALAGKPATAEAFRAAAEAAMQGAKGYEHNAFKIELAKSCIVRALDVAAKGVA